MQTIVMTNWCAAARRGVFGWRLLALTALVASLVVLGGPVRPVAAASIVVNTLADADPPNLIDNLCSLREAIRNANDPVDGIEPVGNDCTAGSTGPTMDTITFSVSGTITTAAALPIINGAAGDDAGYVEIDGGGNIVLVHGVGAGAGIGVGRAGALTTQVTIKRLEITGFGPGVEITRASTVVVEDCIIHGNAAQGVVVRNVNTSGVVIRNNRIGLNSAGAVSGNGNDGVQVTDGADNVTIEGNTISANGVTGITVLGGGGDGSGHLIKGNRIGTDLAGVTCGPGAGSPPPWNTYGNANEGIELSGGVHDSTIEGNVIGCSGRTQASGGTNGDGVKLAGGATSVDNLISGNYIGTNAAGANLGNAQNGIEVNGGTTRATIQQNVIAHNGFPAGANNNNDGVHVDGASTDQIRITRNSIYHNSGQGIALRNDGAAQNDNLDGDGGSNQEQNFPVITAASQTGPGTAKISGTLNSLAGTTFGLEFFCGAPADADPVLAPRSEGEGRSYGGSTVVTTDGSGNATFTDVPISFVAACNGGFFSAVAIDPVGNTSEFSRNFAPLDLPVQIVSFAGRRAGQAVALSWETVSEIKNAGFRVWREDANGRLAPVGPGLIPARGAELGGATYAFTDWAAPREATTYWLDDVSTTGGSERHGPVEVGAASGHVIELPGPRVPGTMAVSGGEQ